MFVAALVIAAGLLLFLARDLDKARQGLERAKGMAKAEAVADSITLGTYDELACCADENVKEFVARAPLDEPRSEAAEVLKQLVGED